MGGRIVAVPVCCGELFFFSVRPLGHSSLLSGCLRPCGASTVSSRRPRVNSWASDFPTLYPITPTLSAHPKCPPCVDNQGLHKSKQRGILGNAEHSSAQRTHPGAFRSYPPARKVIIAPSSVIAFVDSKASPCHQGILRRVRKPLYI